MPAESVRLQAYLARAGVASRRASEDLIRAGRVQVNGRLAELGMSVDASVDTIEVDGRVITPQRLQWIVVHKPRGYVTTRDDPEGRKTVYDLLPDHLRHLFHVGRLDRDSSGLLLLTNDGESAHRLLHPRYGTTKEYYVDVEGEPTEQDLRQLVRGVRLEDGIAKAESAAFRTETKPGIVRVAVVMREGKRREVRRMFDSIGFPVRRLFRRRFGPIDIGRLAPGEWRYLTEEELASLADRPGRRLREPPAAAGRGSRRGGTVRGEGGPRRSGRAGKGGGRAPEGTGRGSDASTGRRGADDAGRPGASARRSSTRRPERGERGGAPDRPERGERPVRVDQHERGDRGERPGGADRPARPRGPRRGGRG